MRAYYQDEAVTIYHGDCRDMLPSLPKVDLVLTDPPYGVGIKYGDAYQDSPGGYWEWFLPVVEQLRAAGERLAFTHRVEALRHVTGWDWVGVWNKPCAFGARVGNSVLLPHWEPIFYFGIHKQGTKADYLSDVLTVLPEKAGISSQIGREKWQANGDFKAHPCPKPIELMGRILVALAPSPDDIVLDPFAGSGTTLFAAKKRGNKTIGIEIEERYCEIAANRCRQTVMAL